MKLTSQEALTVLDILDAWAADEEVTMNEVVTDESVDNLEDLLKLAAFSKGQFTEVREIREKVRMAIEGQVVCE